MNNNIVYALYDDDDILLTSVKKMKEKKLNRHLGNFQKIIPKLIQYLE